MIILPNLYANRPYFLLTFNPLIIYSLIQSINHTFYINLTKFFILPKKKRGLRFSSFYLWSLYFFCSSLSLPHSQISFQPLPNSHSHSIGAQQNLGKKGKGRGENKVPFLSFRPTVSLKQR